MPGQSEIQAWAAGGLGGRFAARRQSRTEKAPRDMTTPTSSTGQDPRPPGAMELIER